MVAKDPLVKVHTELHRSETPEESNSRPNQSTPPAANLLSPLRQSHSSLNFTEAQRVARMIEDKSQLSKSIRMSKEHEKREIIENAERAEEGHGSEENSTGAKAVDHEMIQAFNKWRKIDNCRKLSNECNEVYLDRFEQVIVHLASKVQPPQQIKVLARIWIMEVNSAAVMSKVGMGKKGTGRVCEVVKNYALRCPSLEGGTAEADVGDSTSRDGGGNLSVRDIAQLASKVQPQQQIKYPVWIWIIGVRKAVVMSKLGMDKRGSDQVSEVVENYALRCPCLERGTPKVDIGDSSFWWVTMWGSSLQVWNRSSSDEECSFRSGDSSHSDGTNLSVGDGSSICNGSKVWEVLKVVKLLREYDSLIAEDSLHGPDSPTDDAGGLTVGDNCSVVHLDRNTQSPQQLRMEINFEKNPELLTDISEAAYEEEITQEVDDDFSPQASGEADDTSHTVDLAAPLELSEVSIVPGPSSQGGLGEKGVVGTTTLSGPSPLCGSGVPVKNVNELSAQDSFFAHFCSLSVEDCLCAEDSSCVEVSLGAEDSSCVKNSLSAWESSCVEDSSHVLDNLCAQESSCAEDSLGAQDSSFVKDSLGAQDSSSVKDSLGTEDSHCDWDIHSGLQRGGWILDDDSISIGDNFYEGDRLLDEEGTSSTWVIYVSGGDNISVEDWLDIDKSHHLDECSTTISISSPCVGLRSGLRILMTKMLEMLEKEKNPNLKSNTRDIVTRDGMKKHVREDQNTRQTFMKAILLVRTAVPGVEAAVLVLGLNSMGGSVQVYVFDRSCVEDSLGEDVICDEDRLCDEDSVDAEDSPCVEYSPGLCDEDGLCDGDSKGSLYDEDRLSDGDSRSDKDTVCAEDSVGANGSLCVEVSLCDEDILCDGDNKDSLFDEDRLCDKDSFGDEDGLADRDSCSYKDSQCAEDSLCVEVSLCDEDDLCDEDNLCDGDSPCDENNLWDGDSPCVEYDLRDGDSPCTKDSVCPEDSLYDEDVLCDEDILCDEDRLLDEDRLYGVDSLDDEHGLSEGETRSADISVCAEYSVNLGDEYSLCVGDYLCDGDGPYARDSVCTMDSIGDEDSLTDEDCSDSVEVIVKIHTV